MATLESTTIINAPPSLVWDHLTNFSAWPSWNTYYPSVTFHGPPALNTPLTFTSRMDADAKPDTSTALLTEWVPGRAFAWTGGPLPKLLSWMVYGVHWFRVEEAKEMEGGKEVVKTRLVQGERVAGWCTFLFTAEMKGKLERNIGVSNREVKERVEAGI